MARILGIDLGDVRTGVAVSDEGEFIASGIGTITEYSEERLLDKLCAIINERNIQKVVMGLPVNMNGTIGPRAEKVQNFARKLSERSGLQVILSDERCSTMVAHSILNETNTRGKKRKKAVDTLSSEIILQDYLDQNRKKSF